MLELEYKKDSVLKEVFDNSKGKTNNEITKILIEKLEDSMKVALDLQDEELFNLNDKEFIRRIESFYGQIPIEIYMINENTYEVNIDRIKSVYLKKHLDKQKLRKDLKEYLSAMNKEVREFVAFYNEISSILDEECAYTYNKRS